jgi:DNA polymerase-3 subunit gamma/tau
MSYQVLARKWRPQVFEDVVGQGHITKTLQNAISTNRLAHAFLFSGPRGVGKTTTARILAKALNCKEGPTPNPCGKCDSCIETAAGTSVDVIEIDGASNRGIEHIRELRETVKYAPAGGKYKVYVIDEVHMLTNEAFNALLKTLEEPPPRVLFIFATTEPHKVPATIHSRCQRYGFKRVSLHEIIGRLRTIASAENIVISEQGLTMIARAAEGSMRDSQSLLDQAVSYSGLAVKDEDLQTILGAVSQEVLRQFTDSLLRRDTTALLQQINDLLERGQDMRQFLSGAVEHLRNAIIARTTREPSAMIELPVSDLEALKQQASGVETERLILLFDNLSKTLEELRWSPHQRFTLEIGLVKACSITTLKPLGEVLDRMKTLEVRLGAGSGPAPRSGQDRIADRTSSYTRPSPGDAVPASRAAGPPPVIDSTDAWTRVIALAKQKRPGLAPVLDGSRIMERSDNALVIGIQGAGFQLEQVEAKDKRALIETAAAEVFQKRYELHFRSLGSSGAGPARKPAVTKKTEPRKQDPLEQDILSIFNGEVIDPGSDEE